VSMPRLNGIEAARRIHEALPQTRILVLTMHDEEEYVVRMVRAGASGYILKDGVVSELIAGILAVNRGQSYFAPETIATRARRAAPPLGETSRAASVSPDTSENPRRRDRTPRKDLMSCHRPIARDVSSLLSGAKEEAHAAGAEREDGTRRAVEAATGRADRRCAEGAGPARSAQRRIFRPKNP